MNEIVKNINQMIFNIYDIYKSYKLNIIYCKNKMTTSMKAKLNRSDSETNEQPESQH